MATLISNRTPRGLVFVSKETNTESQQHFLVIKEKSKVVVGAKSTQLYLEIISADILKFWVYKYGSCLIMVDNYGLIMVSKLN